MAFFLTLPSVYKSSSNFTGKFFNLHILKDVIQFHSSPGPGMWGGGAQTVDNGTAAWGQTSDAATGWGDPDEPGKTSGWGNPSPNPGKPGKNRKHM